MYRRRWRTARELGAGVTASQAGEASGRSTTGLTWTAQPHLRVRSYNVGGDTSDVYAVLHQWLTQESQDDIVIIQELHWGCGRQDGSWEIPGWSVIVTADDKHRYSGVGVFVSINESGVK